ncbi:galactose oxidase [Lichtheimia hyalospora FSU 10163]|nr:galactose oxidase [Lichtheimia hyalospora FSU 10163]
MSATLQLQSISGIITQVRETLGEVPPALVGASSTVVGDKAYVFGGRLMTTRKLVNYMYILDLKTLVWTRYIAPFFSDQPPRPRYFHSACAYNNSIIIFGGIGHVGTSKERLLDDLSIFDIDTMCWKVPDIAPSEFAPQPRYAHLAVTTVHDCMSIVGGQDNDNNYIGDVNVLDLKKLEWRFGKTQERHFGVYQSVAVATQPNTPLPAMLKESLGEIPSDETIDLMQNPEEPNPLYLYTNMNFGRQSKQELLLVLSPGSPRTVVEDCSAYMNGSPMPPALRFPTGHSLGHHLILSGTHLSAHSHEFMIWSLDLGTLTWTRIDTGTRFASGSWNRGVPYENANRMLVFGNPSRKLLEDYNHRLVNFDYVAMVDLEAFGVYKMPQATCSSLAQEMGLSLLNEPAFTDFHIITKENQTIRVNSAVMQQRWPYFADMIGSPRGSMVFPYPYPVVLGLVQYLYTDNLFTTQQYQPHVLSQLLLLADIYGMKRLQQLATHALHQMLSISTAPLIFETAALSHQTSLQIRALKMMITAKKMLQKQQELLQQEGGNVPSTTSTTSASRLRYSSTFNTFNNSSRPTSSITASTESAGGTTTATYTNTSPSTSSFTPSQSSSSYDHHQHLPPPPSSSTRPRVRSYTVPKRGKSTRQKSSPAHLLTVSPPPRPSNSTTNTDSNTRAKSWASSPVSRFSTLSAIDDRNEGDTTTTTQENSPPSTSNNQQSSRSKSFKKKSSSFFESIGNRFSISSQHQSQ